MQKGNKVIKNMWHKRGHERKGPRNKGETG